MSIQQRVRHLRHVSYSNFWFGAAGTAHPEFEHSGTGHARTQNWMAASSDMPR